MSQGSRISTTTLTEEYTFEKFLEGGSGELVLLLAWSEKGKLAPYSSKLGSIVGPGWTIASIAPTAEVRSQSPKTE